MRNVILYPKSKRRNPTWLKRLARWIGAQRKIVADYRFFRMRGFTRQAALFNARNTPTL